MIDGLATDTIVALTRIMKKPTIMAQSACHGSATGAAPPPGRPRSAVVISPPRLGLPRWCRLGRHSATAIDVFLRTSQPADPAQRGEITMLQLTDRPLQLPTSSNSHRRYGRI